MERGLIQLYYKLRERLKVAVERNQAEGILLSGGLDTSILALLLSSLRPRVKAFNIRLKNYGEDFEYACMLASKLDLDLHPKEIEVEEAIKAIPEVISIRRSFDPALPNDLALYFAFKYCREEGIESVMTGDGADELFAGYSYMFDLNLDEYIPSLAKRMNFSANELGSYFGIEVKQPFLDKEVIELALSLSPDLKVKEEWGKKYGKWILRKAFQDFLPEKIIWQDKRPIEQGTGFTKLREIIEEVVSDEEFKKCPIKLLSKEHLFYFQTYQKVVGEIPKAEEGEKGCPNCGAGIKKSSTHCRVCGWNQSL